MVNTTPQPMAIHNLHKPLRPGIPLHRDEQLADSRNREQSDQDELVTEILESTRRIRRRTDNREILAILDEIVWLTRSI